MLVTEAIASVKYKDTENSSRHHRPFRRKIRQFFAWNFARKLGNKMLNLVMFFIVLLINQSPIFRWFFPFFFYIYSPDISFPFLYRPSPKHEISTIFSKIFIHGYELYYLYDLFSLHHFEQGLALSCGAMLLIDNSSES